MNYDATREKLPLPDIDTIRALLNVDAPKIKALSVRQPWASAIMLGKDVENRTRYFSHRGLLLIHAALKVDNYALDDPRIVALGIGSPEKPLILGHIIGAVTLLDCVRDYPSPWAYSEEWHLVLANPRPFRRAVACRGQLGLFEVDRDVVRELLEVGV